MGTSRSHPTRSWSVGVISDTHGLLRPEALDALAGSDLIVHAGDIGNELVIDRLSSVAPVYAVCGNTDVGESWCCKLRDRIVVQAGVVLMLVMHNVHDLGRVPDEISVVITGHSHRPGQERRGRVLFFNPGSAGPRRFHLPISVGRLVVNETHVQAEVLVLAESDG